MPANHSVSDKKRNLWKRTSLHFLSNSNLLDLHSGNKLRQSNTFWLQCYNHGRFEYCLVHDHISMTAFTSFFLQASLQAISPGYLFKLCWPSMSLSTSWICFAFLDRSELTALIRLRSNRARVDAPTLFLFLPMDCRGNISVIFTWWGIQH